MCHMLNIGDNNHKSRYSINWLKDFGKIQEKEINLWGSKLKLDLPRTDYNAVNLVLYEIMSSDDGLKHWLSNIDKFGIGFVENVPPNAKDTEKVAKRISHIRQTHYGSFWSFTSNMEHGDTAYTQLALPAHTDTTYFTDPVGLQFFHIIEHDGTGGESLYVDGFNAALILKERKKWAFDILTNTKISAHCAGDEDFFVKSPPFSIISLEKGQLKQIRYNNDDRSPLELSNSEIVDFYHALKEWNNVIKDPQNELWIKLKPGLAVMVDNWRVLHGRAAFTGKRTVMGCYHGRDDYLSRLKTLVYPKEIDKI